MALPERKYYKGAPVSTTLSSSVTSTGTTINVASVTGWPTSYPFYAVIDPGTSKEEKVKVTNISTLALTVTRGQDDTSGSAHDANAVIYPVFTATEANEANLIASAMTTKGDIISTDGSSINRLAVGTNTHVLQADSAVTNGVKWGQVQTAGIADSAITSAKIADGTIAALDIAAAALKLLCPVGTIAAYGGAAAPTGWLLCDGSSISAPYTELINLVGANTPDIRGRFPIGDNATLTLRGTGGSLTISEANLPSHTHAMKSHTHTVSGVTIYDSGSSGNWGVLATNQTGNINAFIQTTATSPTGGPNDNTSNATGSGTDYYPPYYVVNYIIKHDY